MDKFYYITGEDLSPEPPDEDMPGNEKEDDDTEDVGTEDEIDY